MVGSRDSIASCNIVLNTITAEVFREVNERLEKAQDRDLEVHDIIKEFATDHQRIVFNGNGYSKEWEEEAKRRGLPNLPTMVDAIPALTTPKAIKLFETFKVFSRAELESRAEIQYESYAKAVNIEARTMINMTTKQIIPAVIRYTTTVADSVHSVGSIEGMDVSVQTDILKKCTQHLKKVNEALHHLNEVTDIAAAMEDGRERAIYYKDIVIPAMADLRTPVDALEILVDKKVWPMPSYGDLIFEV